MDIANAAVEGKSKASPALIRQTYLQRRWPDTPIFQNIAAEWSADLSYKLLNLIWLGYDSFVANDLQTVAFDVRDEAREESLNYLLALRMDQLKGNSPFSVVYQVPEQTKRKCGRGRSPQPDIGFVLYEYPRTVWPIEGKVLLHEHDVSAYLMEIETNFAKARYATFSSEGAMVGYLVAGSAESTLSNIGNDLGTELRIHPKFKERPQRLSNHNRTELPDPETPIEFVCHHLILSVEKNAS